MQPRRRGVAGRVWESAVRDRVRVLGHDFRMVSLDVEVQTSPPSEKAIYLCVAIEPVEVRLWLDKSHPETDLAMGPVSGLGRTNAVVEPVAVQDQERLGIAGQRHVCVKVGREREVVVDGPVRLLRRQDRKSTRLNSSHT